MQTETQADLSWIKSLEDAFEPYPKFIENLVKELALLEKNLNASALEILPSKEVSAPSPKRQTAAPSVKLTEKKVLLVDDAEINRVLMSHYFRGLPVKLDFAVNGTLACDKCKVDEFDLIVIDFDSNGETVAKNLRAQGFGALLLALSPNSFSDTEKETALAAGFNHYLSRGLPREELVQDLKIQLWK